MECIESKKTKGKNGYCVVRDKRYPGRLIYHHRIVYCDHHDLDLEDIKDLQIRHACDNRMCINPEHLLLGTNAQNVQDKVDRNRQLKGEQIKQSVLTDASVRAIREEYVPRSRTHGQYALSRKYGVSRSLISYVVNRKTWTHI